MKNIGSIILLVGIAPMVGVVLSNITGVVSYVIGLSAVAIVYAISVVGQAWIDRFDIWYALPQHPHNQECVCGNT